jgi:DedD protein
LNAQLKERLIGAAVLIALGVWLIPWVLDGPEPQPDSVDLELPAAEDSGPVRTETILLDQGIASGRPESGDGGIEEPVPTTELASAEPARDSAELARRAAAPAADLVSDNASETAPETAVEAAVDTARQTEGLWVVQLGSFGDENNARRLADRVSVYGYQASVSPFRAGGRAMHRVRIGPQESRAEAEVIASALSAHGFVAQVVTRN